jgi:NADH dehydrogenase
MRDSKADWKDESKPHVVILGGGFGGLYTARALHKAPVRITLVDRRNHHLFQPLLYQVATAGLSPGDIAYPIRSVLSKQRNTRVILGEVTSIDSAAKKVTLANGELDYDYLIVATGATHAYFGHEEWRPFAPGLKTIEDALEIRRRILMAFECAEVASTAEERRAWLTFTVVGAGPTGVELAGALCEIALKTMARDFRAIDPTDARVILVEGQGHVLPTYHEKLSIKARRQLEALGVEVKTNAMVSDITEDTVRLGEEVIHTRTTLWAAGVAASPLAESLSVPLDGAGRVLVASDLSVPGRPSCFVIGDLAAVLDGESTVPGVAPAAVQGAKYVAALIRRELRAPEAKRKPFRYRDKGALATIGRAAAVADLGKVRLSGFTAWIVWWMIHIGFLIGFRSRLLVMFGWAWNYLTFGRGARLITSKGEQHQLPPP